MKKTIIVTEPQTAPEFEAYFLTRFETLRKPWKQPAGSERDETDAMAIHAMALDENQVLGVCRLQMNSSSEAQLRYMGVSEKARGQGVGRLLILYMEDRARKLGATKMILQAREEAIPFYEKCGYSIVEKSYLMWNEIQHYLMQKQLQS